MTLRLSQTLAEFGAGFAFVGRQYHLDVDGDDFYVDLLLYHVPSDRYVVVELKAGKFKPEHLGQLNFYVASVNDGSTQPLAVSSYTYDALPQEEKTTLPSPEAIAAALEVERDLAGE